MSKTSVPVPPPMKVGEMLDILRRKKVWKFHHANTVKTSLAYIECGGLLSRQQGEERAIGQTSQYTDDKDKELGIWDMVFIDTIDIHSRLNKRNHYGPVLFEFDMKVLTVPAITAVRASRKNPANWTDDDKTEDRWFIDADDLAKNFNQESSYSNSIILTCRNGALPLMPHLEYITLDHPHPKVTMPGTDKHPFSVAYRLLQPALRRIGSKAAVLPRSCPPFCECSGYRRMSTEGLTKCFQP